MNRLKGATLAIGNDTYTVPANGKVEAYYLPGTYDYTLKLAKHKALTGKVTVAKSGETKSVYKFENIASDVNKATLVHSLLQGMTRLLTASQQQM